MYYLGVKRVFYRNRYPICNFVITISCAMQQYVAIPAVSSQTAVQF